MLASLLAASLGDEIGTPMPLPSPPHYRIRRVSRSTASPRPSLSQEWEEWQVQVGRKVHSRHDTLRQAAEAAAALDTRPAGGDRDRVTRCVDLLLLDQAEVTEGARDGLADRDMAPGPNRTRSYWHGWHTAQPWTRPEPHPDVVLVQELRAVLGEDFMAVLMER